MTISCIPHLLPTSGYLCTFRTLHPLTMKWGDMFCSLLRRAPRGTFPVPGGLSHTCQCMEAGLSCLPVTHSSALAPGSPFPVSLPKRRAADDTHTSPHNSHPDSSQVSQGSQKWAAITEPDTRAHCSSLPSARPLAQTQSVSPQELRLEQSAQATRG